MRRRWSMSGPNAFSMRRAISGVSADLAWRRSESVARRTFRISAAFETERPRASMISVRIRSPGWGGFFMGMAVLLVVVDRVNVAGSVRLFAVAENQTPVSGDGQAPESFQTALERVQLPSRKPAELVEGLGGFDGERKFPRLVGHRGWQSFGGSRRESDHAARRSRAGGVPQSLHQRVEIGVAIHPAAHRHFR